MLISELPDVRIDNKEGNYVVQNPMKSVLAGTDHHH